MLTLMHRWLCWDRSLSPQIEIKHYNWMLQVTWQILTNHSTVFTFNDSPFKMKCMELWAKDAYFEASMASLRAAACLRRWMSMRTSSSWLFPSKSWAVRSSKLPRTFWNKWDKNTFLLAWPLQDDFLLPYIPWPEQGGSILLVTLLYDLFDGLIKIN